MMAYALYSFSRPLPTLFPPPFTPNGPTPTVVVTRPPVESVPDDTLSILQQTLVPVNDLCDLACRLEGKCNIPETVAPPAAQRQVGEQDTFWVTNIDTNENFQVTSTLHYVTDHAYFWIQDGVRFNLGELEDLAEAFEYKIYPTNRAFFGSEWSPGVDGDPHIYILFARGLGFSIAGYYSSADEYHPLAHEYSNAHEMFLFSADSVSLDSEFTYGVLAHEFQHMIHWYLDRNESSWLNEGFSELAAFLNGYNVGGFDWVYVSNPDLQLNDWPNDPSATTPHYGAGFLFVTYFLDRFGNEATQALARNPQNGLESVDGTLAEIGATDPLTGLPITADDLFMDWVVTNYLMDGSVNDGRYTYHIYGDAPQSAETEAVSACPLGLTSRTAHQYGVDYIRITCSGDFILHFEGATSTRLLPADPYSGAYTFWSNKGDESDMTLTRQFDFTSVSAPITLTYWTWYDLEEDYDYLYLEASSDDQYWQILITPSGTAEDPSGNSYGWGYNGVSGGWIQESVDLSQFAGQVVYLRFEYVTDAAVNGEGLLLDDIAIPEIGYFADLEADDGGWQAAGFVRVQNVLPQTFRLALITRGPGGITVTMIPVNPDQTADMHLSLGGDTYEAVLVV
ncbi:MAG: immune inhibitor A, partial [Chloroflexi bacterium]|nr:immune inhibitor A [Chloroflexota bacterium]